MSVVQAIERHGGFVISHDPEYGFVWRNGCSAGGEFDTIEECRRSIDDYNSESLEQAQREGRVPTDSPCLEHPWWETQR